MATLWINQAYFNKRSVVDSNVEYSKIEPLISLVQRKYIKRKTRTDLYNVIDAAILNNINNSVAIPTDIKYLLDEFIMPAIVYYTLYEYTLPAKLRYTNKGIMVKRSENSDAADPASLELIMGAWQSDAELHIEEMLAYILANPGLYPSYFTNVTLTSPRGEDAYEVDMYLDDSVKICMRCNMYPCQCGNRYYNKQDGY